MKAITAFYLHGCPYCKNAMKALEELRSENKKYKDVTVNWYEETEHPEVVKGHDYYYAPSLFLDTEKVYEAQPGQSYDEIKAHVQSALDAALRS